MGKVYCSALIRRPREKVFNFVTDPGYWPLWHPSSLGITGASGYSLEVNEKVTEKFRVAGRKGLVTWEVLERRFPDHWLIVGEVAGGAGRGTITYSLAARKEGTYYEREFCYSFSSPLFAILDRFLIQPKIRAESEEAVCRLKRILEAS